MRIAAMTTVSAYEAKTHLPRRLQAVARGETVIITRHGKPMAQLGPVKQHDRAAPLATLDRRLAAAADAAGAALLEA